MLSAPSQGTPVNWGYARPNVDVKGKRAAIGALLFGAALIGLGPLVEAAPAGSSARSQAGAVEACAARHWVGAWMAAAQGSSADLTDKTSTSAPTTFDDQ